MLRIHISVLRLWRLVDMSEYFGQYYGRTVYTNAMILHRYLLTLPAEWRFYKSQRSILNMRYVEMYDSTDSTAQQCTASLVYSSF